jgi:hypothetical protein
MYHLGVFYLLASVICTAVMTTFPIRLLLLYFQINLHIQTYQDEETGN